MLVLSRKVKQEFSFVNLGIKIEILRVSGKKVQVGVSAPDSVRVLRSELVEEETLEKLEVASRVTRHAFRNQLNTASLTLSVLQHQVQSGQLEKAEKTLESALSQLSELDAFTGAAPAFGNETSPEKRRRTALVVEDNAQERELLAEYLRVNGFDVSVAEDGEDAMDYLAQHHAPDVVLLDMNMPRMNGTNTAKAIRCDPRFQELKLFVISGCDPEETPPESESPYDQWFSKPIRPQQFLSDIESHLGSAC
ncbi:response regulator [Rhodopirellula halodulae]|uniref:response regulator n=1 Tax=Rhodopirellula halodulae TaxID=2894198 RepID=UPI001E2C4894|nr:response regulator [Rhodopirellula sp. JC737]MCC9656262.1 response regulator [Rhodopirellula sp. JC737]